MVPTVEALLLLALVAGGPGRIDRRSAALRTLSIALVGVLAPQRRLVHRPAADRGTAARAHRLPRTPALAFSQQLNPELASADWRSRYIDHLCLGLTNATAFSPTDVMPLAPWAKIAMGLGPHCCRPRSRSRGPRPAVPHGVCAQLHPGPDPGHVHEVAQAPVQSTR